MNPRPMEELCRRAAEHGCHVELYAAPHRRSAVPRLTRLMVRDKADPGSVRYMDLRHPTAPAVDTAAARLLRALLEAP